MAQTSPTPSQLLVEACVFWSIGLVLFIGRIMSRAIVGGSIKRLQADDYVMMFTFCLYTVLLIMIQVSGRYATNLMDPADYPRILADPKEVESRIYGSKIVILLEQCMLTSTWGVKTCLLITYWNLTRGLKNRLYIKILAVYVAVGYIVIQITYYGVYCRPFSQYWAMPVRNIQCATYQYYSITNLVFNISSDVLILAVPIPLVFKLQVSLRRKLILLGVFSLGVFVIIAAIFNKYFNLTSLFTTIYMIWYIREASTAIFVSNLMCWWPLLRKLFGLNSFDGNSSGRLTSAKGFNAISASQSKEEPHTLGGQRFRKKDESASEEVMMDDAGQVELGDMRHEGRGPLEIWRQVEYDVEEHQLSDEESGSKLEMDHHGHSGIITSHPTVVERPIQEGQ